MNKSADIAVHHRSVLGSTMAFRDSGTGEKPVALFLHGNPTSSYIWRNILPLVAPVARCIAPDLIGFGQSGKPDIAYSFADQARYLDALIDELGIDSAYLVAQDWGTALAFHLAARRPDFVRGLAFMEFIRPMPSWDDFHQSETARQTFRKFRTGGEGEAMILDGNVFVERVLPGPLGAEAYADGRYTPLASWAGKPMSVAVTDDAEHGALVITLTATGLEKRLRFDAHGGVQAAFRWDHTAFPDDAVFTTELSFAQETPISLTPGDVAVWKQVIKTVARSERGFDETVQGMALTPRWPVRLGEGVCNVELELASALARP